MPCVGRTSARINEVARRTLEVNYRGPVRLTEALLSRLSERANVVMVSSGIGELHRFADGARKRLLDPSLDRAALDGWLAEFLEAVEQGHVDQAGFPRKAYSVSKAALNAYTRILFREFAVDSFGTANLLNGRCLNRPRRFSGTPSREPLARNTR